MISTLFTISLIFSQQDPEAERLKLIKELESVQKLMSESEKHLFDSTRTADNDTLSEILKKYKVLEFKKPVIELPPYLLNRSKQQQKDALDKLQKLIKEIEDKPQ
ncbi:MAG: hypothetical protein HY606_10075 [Planctomycetes bacterium]|nr:hypothetical protein [Planctomycetota bacterium]